MIMKKDDDGDDNGDDNDGDNDDDNDDDNGKGQRTKRSQTYQRDSSHSRH